MACHWKSFRVVDNFVEDGSKDTGSNADSDATVSEDFDGTVADDIPVPTLAVCTQDGEIVLDTQTPPVSGQIIAIKLGWLWLVPWPSVQARQF